MMNSTGPLATLLLLTLPLVWPGVPSGWLFAFIVSFGELNAALPPARESRRCRSRSSATGNSRAASW